MGGYDVYCAICGATLVRIDWPGRPEADDTDNNIDEVGEVEEGDIMSDEGGGHLGEDGDRGDDTDNDGHTDMDDNEDNDDEGEDGEDEMEYDPSVMDVQSVSWIEDVRVISENPDSISMEK
jgi:hypothetical protein